MSIEVMSRVWKHSRAYSGYLLVLLAIADHADDDGQAYPSIAGLAHKSRMTERQVHRAVTWLLELGELRVEYKQGPKGKNLYSIEVSVPPKRDRHPDTHVTVTNLHSDVGVTVQPTTETTPESRHVTVTPTSGNPDVHVTVSLESPESSVFNTKNKPSVKKTECI